VATSHAMRVYLRVSHGTEFLLHLQLSNEQLDLLHSTDTGPELSIVI
jgi:hypothetical protein